MIDELGDISLFVDILCLLSFLCLLLRAHLLSDSGLTPCIGNTEGNPPLQRLSCDSSEDIVQQNPSLSCFQRNINYMITFMQSGHLLKAAHMGQWEKLTGGCKVTYFPHAFQWAIN